MSESDSEPFATVRGTVPAPVPTVAVVASVGVPEMAAPSVSPLCKPLTV